MEQNGAALCASNVSLTGPHYGAWNEAWPEDLPDSSPERLQGGVGKLGAEIHPDSNLRTEQVLYTNQIHRPISPYKTQASTRESQGSGSAPICPSYPS